MSFLVIGAGRYCSGGACDSALRKLPQFISSFSSSSVSASPDFLAALILAFSPISF